MIEPYIQDCQFSPIEIELGERYGIEGGGEVLRNYYWMTCGLRLDLVDYDRSELSFLPPRGKRKGAGPPPTEALYDKYEDAPIDWDGAKHLAVRRPPKGAHLFKLKGGMGDQMFVSESLWQAIKTAGLKVPGGGYPGEWLDTGSEQA